MNVRRALLLDVDGVLVLPPEMFGTRLMRLHPREAQEFFYGPFLKASTGQAELLELLPPLLSATGYAGTPEDFMQEWFEAENHPNSPLLREVKALREAGWPACADTLVVMLDGDCAFQHLDPAGVTIWWGAYVGMDAEIILTGPLHETGQRILVARSEARAKNGWIMDVYVLRREKA